MNPLFFLDNCENMGMGLSLQIVYVVDAVGRRQAEGHLGRWATSVRVLATDGEAGIVGHAVKLWVMSVEDAAIALLPVRHVINSFVWVLLLFGSRTRRVQANGLETASILRESRRQSCL